MSMLSKRNTILVVGILLAIIIGVSGWRGLQPDQSGGETPPDGDLPDILDILSQEDLDELKTSLEAFEFEDLGGLLEDGYQGLEQGIIGPMIQDDLDALLEALEALEFEDLGGLPG